MPFLLHSSIISASASPLLAYGSRYRAPNLKTFVYPLQLPHHHPSPPPHHHHLLPRVLSAHLRAFSPLPFPTTGNSSLSRMERKVFGLVLLVSVSTMLMNYSSKSGSGMEKNKGMVGQLRRCGVVSSVRVAEVMENIDRGLFVPAGSPAYMDSPMPIGHNATISAPHMHAMCLELLKDHLQPGMHALDVGSGTGYLTACFAMMVGSQGRAVGIEHIPELFSQSIENIKKSAAADLLEKGSLSVHVGDGRLGYPEAAPYDAIHVGAAAAEIPKALTEQLKPGGRLVIPVGTFFQDLQVIDKKQDGSLSSRTVTSVRYVPLTSREEQLRG